MKLARGNVRDADALLDELAANARLAVKWLDHRKERSAPVTVTALRRHLHREPLQLRQARVALLSWLASGYVVASDDSKFYDARAVWSAESADELASSTRRAAEALAGELYGRCWCADDVQRRIGYRLEQEALSARQEAWGRHAVSDSPTQRQQTRRSVSADRQLELLNHLDDAAARDGAGDWHGAAVETWAAAILRDASEVTGYSQLRAAGLLRAAVKRLRQAGRLGFKPTQVRRAVRAELEGLMARARSYAEKGGGSGFPPLAQVIEPLTSAGAFERVLGWVGLSVQRVGWIEASKPTHPAGLQATGTADQSGDFRASEVPPTKRLRRTS